MLNKKTTIFAVALFSAVRLYAASILELHPDEAYYWLWSKHLSAGFFDHPGLIAFFIKLTTLLGGGELFVRLGSVLVSVVLSILIWKLTLSMFEDEKVASGSVLLLNLYPLTFSGSLITTPDVPLFLFWGISIFLFWQAVKTQKVHYWYFLGISAGLALASKYTAVLLFPCLLTYLLFTKERKWLTTIHPYIAVLLSALVFLPVVLWNAGHNWASFSFQLSHGAGGSQIHFDKFFDYLGGQLLVAGPFVFLAALVAGSIYLFSKDNKKFFLAITSMPIIVFFAVAAFKKSSEANWPAVAYFTLSILVSVYLLKGSKLKARIWVFSVIFSALMSVTLLTHAMYGVIPIKNISTKLAVADATNWVHGWHEIAQEIQKRPGIDFVVTPSHQLSAQLEYYTGGKIPVFVDKTVARYSQYNLWSFEEKSIGKNGLYIFDSDMQFGRYKDQFESINTVDAMVIYRNGVAIRKYTIVSGHKYKGINS